MKKKTTPKRKSEKQTVEIESISEGLPPIDYIALTFWGRFVLSGLFIRKAFVCLFKGRATV